jgi:3-oxoisoapionate decarboxylase
MEAEHNAPRLGRIGVSSWAYPWAVGSVHEQRPIKPMSAFELVRKATGLRVSVVQIADNLPVSGLTPDELEELHALAQDSHIDLQLGTRGTDQTQLLDYLRIAQRLEVKLVRLLGGKPGQAAPLAEVEKNIRAALPAFTDADVSLALENYESYTTADLKNVVESIGHPNFGICLDVTNSFAGLESADQILDNLAPFALNVHLKDFVIERTNHLMGFACVGRPLGTGQLPLNAILGRLTEFHHCPDLIIELWPPPGRSLGETISMEEAWAAESVDYLRTLLQKLKETSNKTWLRPS